MHRRVRVQQDDPGRTGGAGYRCGDRSLQVRRVPGGPGGTLRVVSKPDVGQRGAAAEGIVGLEPVRGLRADWDQDQRRKDPRLKPATDPFTTEIIGEMLRASAEEMFVLLGRTAQSPIIYEGLAMAGGLVAAEGGVIAQAG